jgi:lipid II:glycine glycyltransferase (peptidoglycan interpeptide bridge formation enzyme)
MSDILNKKIDDNEIRDLGGSVYHTESWRQLINRAFGYEPEYIFSYDGEIINGLIPAFLVKSMFMSPHLTIAPFSHHVEPLSKDDVVLERLIVKLKDLCKKEGCKYIEFHGGGESLSRFGFIIKEMNWITYLNLDQYSSDLWDGIRSSTQRNIKKAEKSGLSVIKGSSLKDYYAFSDLVLETRQYQGSLPYPRKLYDELFENSYSRLYLCQHDGKIIAGLVLLLFGKNVIYAYGASLKDGELLKLRPNDLLFWNAISETSREGFKIFDFGTTPINNEGLLRYKENWGAKSEKLSYAYWMEGEESLPLINRDSAMVKFAEEVIKRTPQKILQFVGPFLLKQLG